MVHYKSFVLLARNQIGMFCTMMPNSHMLNNLSHIEGIFCHYHCNRIHQSMHKCHLVIYYCLKRILGRESLRFVDLRYIFCNSLRMICINFRKRTHQQRS